MEEDKYDVVIRLLKRFQSRTETQIPGSGLIKEILYLWFPGQGGMPILHF